MPGRFRGIRLATLLMAVAVCAVIFGLGVHLYRAWSPVRRWTRESRPGNPSFMRMHAVLNLTHDVPQSQLEEAFPVLLAAAKDPDPMIRASAASALSGRRDHFAEVLSVLRALMNDPSPRVRESTIVMLERFVKPGSPEVSTLIPELVAALDDPKPAVRIEACRALYTYGRLHSESQRVVPAMSRLIREEEGTHRLAALGYLMMIKSIPKDLEPSLRALLTSDNPAERILVRQALIQFGISDQERDGMIKSMLESSHLTERLAAADLLIQIGKPEMAIPALKDLIASENNEIRARAARLLGPLKNGEDSP
jgi:HEAT repeat protein